MALLGDQVSHFGQSLVDEALTVKGDFIDRLTEHVADSQPYSWRAFSAAIFALVLATGIRASFGILGSHFPLTFYFPAILAVGVLVGIPAAVSVSLAAVAIVWFAFIPPYLQLGWPKAEDFTVWLLFVLASSVTIVVAWLCRTALLRLHRHQLAYRTVAHELRHRDKNSLAVTEAIIKKTLQHDHTSADAIIGRLRAVDYANDLLVRSALPAVELRTLIENELTAYGDTRFVAQGPRLKIPTSSVRHVLLIIHELATNAAKYGALSILSGRVLIDWEMQNGRTVLVRWREQGGPPVQSPTRNGFGSTLIVQSVRALSGQLDQQFKPDGLCCSFTLRGAAANDTPGVMVRN
jgi:two-component sensor histidine kinase